MTIETIKKEYETTKTSFKTLADKYETHYKKLQRRAKKEGWVKYNPTITKTPKPPKTPQHSQVDTQTPTHDIKELLKGYFQPIDNIMLELFIDTYISYQELKKEVAIEKRILTSKKGGTYYNPKYSALQMEKMNLIKIQKELGVTIAQRVRLKLNIESQDEDKKPSIFDIISGIMDGSIEPDPIDV